MKYDDLEGELQAALTAAIGDSLTSDRLRNCFSHPTLDSKASRFCAWVTTACDSHVVRRIDLGTWSDIEVANSLPMVVGFVSEDWESPAMQEFFCAALRLTSRAVCGRLAS